MIKGPQCNGCALQSPQRYQRYDSHRLHLAPAYALPDGRADSPVAFIGEALGEDEAGAALRDAISRNFVGRAGGVLNKGLHRLGRIREEQRVSNVVRCRPPLDNLVDWGHRLWGESAIQHCAPALDEVLWEPGHRVFVTLGVTATKEVLRRWGVDYKGKMESWAGYVLGPDEGPWVVPSFHPSFILHDKHGMTVILYQTIKRAFEVAEGGWVRSEPDLVVDPPPDWFSQWAAGWDPEQHWLAVDVETREKLAGQDEDEIQEDQPLTIVRINFAYHPDQGITVPWTPEYLPTIRRLLSRAQGTYVLWNDHFDLRCLEAAGVPILGRVFDGMAAWHCLQSDVRKSLGFVAPWFSSAAPWKHLSDVNPGEYAAKDAAQTLRIIFGLIPLLEKGGQLRYAFQRHVVDLDRLVLRPAEHRGPRVDREFLAGFRERLRETKKETVVKAQGLVPEEALVVSGDRTRPDPEGHPGEFPLEVERDVQQCLSCTEYPVSVKHVCKDEKGKKIPDAKPNVCLVTLPVTRYFDRELFEPGRSSHLLAFIQQQGIPLPAGKKSKKKKTDAPTLDAKVLDELARYPTDNQVKTLAASLHVPKAEAEERLVRRAQLFQEVLNYRDVDHVDSTYACGALGRLAEDGKKAMPCRLFKEQSWEVLRGQEFHHAASTQRLTCKVFPLQGVVADKEGNEGIAAGFRKCIVPRPGMRLVEVDYRGIEAQITGWFCRDPEYIKWAKRDIHSYVTSHKLGKPPSLSWSEDHIRGYLKEIKAEHEFLRDQVKHVVHGVSYGRTVYGIQKGHPEAFPNLASAQATLDLYFSVAPKLRDWQAAMRNFAKDNNYLGGPAGPGFPSEHPFGYIHWFWAITEWDAKRREMRMDGPDSNRVVSFFPQSAAFGTLAEADLELAGEPETENYIGDAVGDPRISTPFLALIHDSNLLEFWEKDWEHRTKQVQRAMERPIEQFPCPPEWGLGEALVIEAEVKHSNTTWAEMQAWKP